MFSEADLLPISALQHLAFCERQWGLIHLEQQWSENRLTVEGNVLHDKTDQPETESRYDLRIARGLRLRSLRLGLTGIADVVEFHMRRNDETESKDEFTRLVGSDTLWRAFPVEYKRGKPKIDHCDLVQLCAQALCLEEMLSVTVTQGALFYGRPRRRTEVAFDSSLREETEGLSAKLHQLNELGKTPSPLYSKKCQNCSLLDVCNPKVTGAKTAPERYLADQLKELHAEGAEGRGGNP